MTAARSGRLPTIEAARMPAGSAAAAEVAKVGMPAVAGDHDEGQAVLQQALAWLDAHGGQPLPWTLLTGEDAASHGRGIDAILQALGNGPLIFNLGHGITPDADPAHVSDLVRQVRGYKP